MSELPMGWASTARGHIAPATAVPGAEAGPIGLGSCCPVPHHERAQPVACSDQAQPQAPGPATQPRRPPGRCCRSSAKWSQRRRGCLRRRGAVPCVDAVDHAVTRRVVAHVVRQEQPAGAPTASNRGCSHENAVAPDRPAVSLLHLAEHAPAEVEGARRPHQWRVCGSPELVQLLAKRQPTVG